MKSHRKLSVFVAKAEYCRHVTDEYYPATIVMLCCGGRMGRTVWSRQQMKGRDNAASTFITPSKDVWALQGVVELCQVEQRPNLEKIHVLTESLCEDSVNWSLFSRVAVETLKL